MRLADRARDLGDLERVRQPGPLMVVGEHEDLGLAGEPTERRGVQDAVAVALEAGAERVGLLRRSRDHRHRRLSSRAARAVRARAPPGVAGEVSVAPGPAHESSWASAIPSPWWPCIVEAQRSARSLRS
jgi:hypothetical protein